MTTDTDTRTWRADLARSATLQEMPLHAFADSGTDTQSGEEHALLDEHIVAYRFDGPLFFGGAHAVLLHAPCGQTKQVSRERFRHLVKLSHQIG